MDASPRVARGFTLMELVVSVAITVVVCMGALALLSAQQRSFRLSADDRALQEEARSALADMTANLRRAGYGVEPWLALDLGPVPNPPVAWPGAAPSPTTGYPAGAPGASPPGCSPAVAVTDRDSTTGPDEIVFYARDPAFNRALAAAPSSAGLKLATALTAPMYQGQILQVMCGGAGAWAYVTVGAFADVGATDVVLDGACTNGFPHQQAMLDSGCFDAGFAAARVFKIQRFHYYVARYLDTATGTTRPYLMLDRGLWSGGAPLVEPIAPNVEDLQFGYVFPGAATTPLVGTTEGTQLANATGSIDLNATPPAYTDITGATSRTTHSPANIRAVRVSVVVRAANPDPNTTGDDLHTIPAAANRGAITNADPGYRRLVVESTESLRNLDSRGPFYTPYSTNAGADGLNVGGG